MSDIRWIKIIVDIFDDEKIRLIETLPDADTILIIWFKLLTMAGKCNDNGIIYLTRDIPYNEEMLSTIMRRPVNTVRLALNEFQKLGMISIENNFIALLNWEKHQSLDKLEKIKIQSRLRVTKHREKQKLICNVTETQCNAIEENRVEENRKEKRETFTPPTHEEVIDYIKQMGFIITADEFIDCYSARGWIVGKGKTKMKDWRAAIRNYVKNDKEWHPEKYREQKSIYPEL